MSTLINLLTVLIALACVASLAESGVGDSSSEIRRDVVRECRDRLNKVGPHRKKKLSQLLVRHLQN